MKNQTCKFEKSVVKESAQGNLNEKLALHVKECAACQETLKVADWMQNFAAAAPERALPTAGFLWWKAKIIEKQEAGKRAARPIVWTQTAAIFLVFAAAAWLVVKYQTKFSIVAENLSASIELVAAPFIIALVFATAVCLAVAVKWREPSIKKLTK